MKLNVSLSIGIANAGQEDVLEIDQDEWDECETDEDRDSLKDSYWWDWANGFIDGGCWIDDPDEEEV